MIENIERIGRFTSSEIAALTTLDRLKTGFGKPALTYIEEKNIERRLGRSLGTETNARPLSWGKCLEPYVFDNLLGIEYSYESDKTLVHSSIPFWSGSPDGRKFDNGGTVVDTKCPYTLKSFCQLVQPLYDGLKGMDAINVLRTNHKDGETYYWQLVSNAILTNSQYAELIVFCPYKEELPAIKQMADGEPNFYFIWAAIENELPYLPDGGYYKNLNVIRFEVPESDKEALTENVIKAGKLLIPFGGQTPDVLIAHHDEELDATIVEREVSNQNS